MFIHIFDKEVFEEIVKRGAIPLKTDCVPFIALLEDGVDINFENINDSLFKFSDTMYL